jgi:hypothetical protein
MEKIKIAKRSLEVYNFSLYDQNDMNTRMDYCNINNNDLYDVLKNNIPQYFENIGPEKLSKKTIKIDSDGANAVFKSNSKLRIITKLKLEMMMVKKLNIQKGQKNKQLCMLNKKESMLIDHFSL